MDPRDIPLQRGEAWVIGGRPGENPAPVSRHPLECLKNPSDKTAPAELAHPGLEVLREPNLFSDVIWPG
jgi:hypothetical protein